MSRVLFILQKVRLHQIPCILDTPDRPPSYPSFPAHGHGGTPSLGPPPIPPRSSYPSGHGHAPAPQPIQGLVQTRPVFPMPQIQHPHVPTTSGPPPPPPPPMMQWSESTRMPSNPHNYPVASGPYPGTSSQVPITMSHSLSQHDHNAGMSGVAHNFPSVPRTRACVPTAYYLRSLSDLRRDLSRGRLEQRRTCRWPRRSGNVPSRPPRKGPANRRRCRGAEM